ncbi:DUF922 domain-containing protein [Xanthocytophaga flava]|uniref:DUF922 domain-containing protein n=1 Tax=Xanthocytophaga flava TaxID=3048013 RepID=UPI0028D43506|nr:DUF922 domain-containing protein [Xanthocytophaga flavus]MDJ1471146.1 DUF922 domain-containing protein [Xanthocytophaga flavus]
MRKVYLTIIFYILCTNLFAQMQKEAEVDSILWNPTEKLRWVDFQGPPNPQALFEKAACASSIYVKGGKRSVGFPDFIVGCYFLKKQSWTLDTLSESLLRHEQGHFDIAELYARKIRQTIDSLHKKSTEDFNIYANNIQVLLEKYSKDEIAYDRETSHGTDMVEQKRWIKKIAFELKRLHNFAKSI